MRAYFLKFVIKQNYKGLLQESQQFLVTPIFARKDNIKRVSAFFPTRNLHLYCFLDKVDNFEFFTQKCDASFPKISSGKNLYPQFM